MIQSFTYLGHSAVLLHCHGYTIGIDPWLEGNPRCPAHLMNPEELDLIVLTHGHSDHAGDTVRLAKKYHCKVAATFELAEILAGEGVPREQIVAMNKGGTITFRDTQISLTHAFHSSSYETKNRGTVYAGEACGAVVKGGKQSIYHAGDTALFEDMNLVREQFAPNVSFLPIGDCFTMGPRDAAEAATRVGSRINVPIHYKTFGLLTGTAEDFQDACSTKDVAVRVVEPGERVLL
jgi:L-ascorbate metabolism protein UlaG (beta-lactamase superfamily)